MNSSNIGILMLYNNLKNLKYNYLNDITLVINIINLFNHYFIYSYIF